MNHLHAIQTLLGQARKTREQAVLRVAEALRHRDNSRQKLSMLEHYRSDYLSRLQHEFKKMASTISLTQYGAFVDKLEAAIQQQKEDLGFREKTLRLVQEKLIECEKRIRSLELYLEKQLRQLAQIENRREQKLMDEYAAGLARRMLQN
jgi:flagellar FliJ protein